jgi:hypothetical protein
MISAPIGIIHFKMIWADAEFDFDAEVFVASLSIDGRGIG